MSKITLPFRQIHLDYHTSEHMKDVASQFNKEDFITTLKEAHVNSVCCFARCHHGWLYYPSEKFPERVHPQLANKNLLIEQVEACKENNIRVPIYLTVQWDQFSASKHPEWLCVDEKGVLLEPIFTPGFYRRLCLNSGYRDFLKELVEDIISAAPATDGLWFDILWPNPCCCDECRKKMEDKGYDWRKPEERMAFAKWTLRDFIGDMTDFVHRLEPECSIYYNDGDVRPDHNTHVGGFTHLEFDALPSGHGSYDGFPIITRMNRHYGIDYAGHTGRFHTGWGDMHSYKNVHALEYECFMLMALGGKCIIGDQLHPLGHMDHKAYKIIGEVYSQVEEKEAWCYNSKPVSEIGVYFSNDHKAIHGVHKLLNHAGYQYDIINDTTDFNGYKLIVLPDEISVTDELKVKLEAFIEKGGKVLASFMAGANDEQDEFILPLGVTMKEQLTLGVDGKPVRGILDMRNDYSDYIRPKGVMGNGLDEVDYVMYTKGNEVVADQGSEVLGHIIKPPFYREMKNYCSHMQTPSYGEEDTPAVVATEHSVYLAHNVFQIYDTYAPHWCRQYVENAIDLLLGQRIVEHDGPSTMEAIMTEQDSDHRYVLHLMHYVPIKRGSELEIIEDVYPLYDIKLSLKLDRDITGIYAHSTRKPIPYTIVDGRIHLTIPKLVGHDMIVLDYENK